jgi:hypothetical protein
VKCNARVITETARRKGTGVPFERVKFIAVAWGVGNRKPWNDSEYVAKNTYECGGIINATVEAVDEPDWCRTYAKLDVQYKCKRCGSVYFRGLPADSNPDLMAKLLSDLLTHHIWELPQEELPI